MLCHAYDADKHAPPSYSWHSPLARPRTAPASSLTSSQFNWRNSLIILTKLRAVSNNCMLETEVLSVSCAKQQTVSSSGLYAMRSGTNRSEEHTSELQSLRHLVCRL